MLDLPPSLPPLFLSLSLLNPQGNSSLNKLLSEKNPSVAEFMSTVLSIHEKFSLMIKEVFSSHKSFSSALDKVCLRRSTLHIM